MMKKLFCFLLIMMTCAIMDAAVSRAAGAGGSYGDYPDYEGMIAEIYELEKQHPDWVEIGEYGRSIQERPLLYVRIMKPGGDELPEAMIAANIHGNEWIGNRVAMAAARRLLEDRNSDEWIASLLDSIKFYVLPCLNPDGYYKTWISRNDLDAVWKVLRKNARGVDINRNFPLPGERTMSIGMAGSDDPDSARYTGAHPYSEPEAAAIRDFVAGRRFFASIDLHSNWGTFFPPKCNSSACEKSFRKMMSAAAERQPHSTYPTVAQWRVDSFTGEMEDELFYSFGIMAVCWEVFPTRFASEQKTRLEHSFWSGNPEDIDHWVENDRDAVLAALEAALKITRGKPVPEKYRKVKLH